MTLSAACAEVNASVVRLSLARTPNARKVIVETMLSAMSITTIVIRSSMSEKPELLLGAGDFISISCLALDALQSEQERRFASRDSEPRA